MIGLGTIVNAAAILVGGALGGRVIPPLPERVRDGTVKALGLGTALLGLQMAWQWENPLPVLISLALGTSLGEWLRIEERLERFAQRLTGRMSGRRAGGGAAGEASANVGVMAGGEANAGTPDGTAEGTGVAGPGTVDSGRFARAFVQASLLFCVGAMAITGSLQDGLTGDPSILYAKSLLDGIFSLMFASVMGPGVMLSAIPVFLYQGLLTVGASAASQFLSPAVIQGLSSTGGLMVLAIGLNLAGATKIRIGNLLPALVFVTILLSLGM